MADGSRLLFLRDPGDLVETPLAFDLSVLGATRTVTGLDTDGVMALSDAVLTPESIPFADASGRLTEDTTFVRDAATGNVGIKRAAPDASLHVNGDSDIVQLMVDGHSTQTGNVFEVRSHGENALVMVDGSGNLGVQVAAPLASFHVGAGQAIFPAGSESVPALTFGDSDTGFYAQIVGTFGFTSNGVEQMLFGAGTAGPPVKSIRLATTVGFGWSTGLYTVDDEMHLYRSSAQVMRLKGNGGTALFQAEKVLIQGAADEVQLSVDANSAQTANVVEIRDELGGDYVVVDAAGNLHVAGSNNELRFYEAANYVGFEAPALAADQIWVLPDADGAVGEQLATDGAGNLSWAPGDHDNSWAYASPSGGGTKTTYAGDFYKHASSADDFSGGPTFGNANGSVAAHFYVVLGAATVDELTIRVTGTSITDGAVRTASDTQDIVIPNSTAVDAYFETTKKWLGQVTITVVSGTAKVCDHGWCKYWDNNNRDFVLVGLQCTWLGGGNDSGANITLRHHKTTGWTYTGSGATPPTEIASMVGDHVTETDIDLNENGAWKRTGLSVAVSGASSEGIIWEVITTGANTFQSATFLISTR